MEAIKMNWDSIFCVNPEKVHNQLKKVLDAYKEVFSEDLGTLKGTKAKIFFKRRGTTQARERSPSALCYESTCRTGAGTTRKRRHHNTVPYSSQNGRRP